MGNPFDVIERFEQKHGDYYELLNLATCNDPSKERRGKSLLRRHNELVWMCVGYMMAHREIQKKGYPLPGAPI